MIRRPPRSTLDRSSAASDVYKRQRQIDLEISKNLGNLNYLSPVMSANQNSTAHRFESFVEREVLDCSKDINVLNWPKLDSVFRSIPFSFRLVSVIAKANGFSFSRRDCS